MYRHLRGSFLVLAIGAMSCPWTNVAFAQDDQTAADSALPKGYDESFQTGDIPKPNQPELDPDASNENELNPDQNPDENPKSDPMLDHVPENYQVGATAALAFPHVINLGLESMFFQRFGASLNYGKATKSIDSVNVSLKHLDVRFRWFPWASSFFAGLAFGQHELTGELDREVKESTSGKLIATHGKLTASANYVAPHFGWFSIWDSGFTLGCDFGYLVPSGAKSTFTSTFANAPAGTEAALMETNEYKKMKKDLEDSAKAQASKPMPYASLLRIGWMF